MKEGIVRIGGHTNCSPSERSFVYFPVSSLAQQLPDFQFVGIDFSVCEITSVSSPHFHAIVISHMVSVSTAIIDPM